jgi:hypothetical protein
MRGNAPLIHGCAAGLAEDTQRRIIAAARSLFASHGYATSTLEAIAELAELASLVEARRRENQARLIASLNEQGILRPGRSLEEAAEIVWVLTSFDLYRMLVVKQRS